MEITCSLALHVPRSTLLLLMSWRQSSGFDLEKGQSMCKQKAA